MDENAKADETDVEEVLAVERALHRLYEKALAGDMDAARLYLQTVGAIDGGEPKAGG